MKTTRLTLKGLENKDSSFILELLNSKGWLDFIGDRNVNNIADALKYIEKINSNKNVNYWVVTLKGTTPIGIITLIKREHLEFYDIGFAFLPSYQNKGYAFEASNRVLNYLVESTGFQSIFATTVSENKSSIKLIEKLGMTFYKFDMQDNNNLSLYKLDLDKVKIDNLVNDFYSAFTNKDKNPNLRILHKTCINEVIIIKNTNGVGETYNLENFIAPRKVVLTNGTLIEFEESEVEEQTTITRNIAQRLSHYQKEGILNKKDFQRKEAKCFNL